MDFKSYILMFWVVIRLSGFEGGVDRMVFTDLECSSQQGVLTDLRGIVRMRLLSK